MHKVSEKIDRLRYERGWSVYKLSQESDVPTTTIHKWFESDTVPSITGLEKICIAFGISLADFFSEHNLVEVSPKVKELYADWCSLSKSEQSVIEAIVKSYKDKK